jgi:hypothetical protein
MRRRDRSPFCQRSTRLHTRATTWAMLNAIWSSIEPLPITSKRILEIASRCAGPIPLGVNVESVSIRRAEIEAAAELVAFARRALPS